MKTLGINSLSKSQVSRMAAELDEHVDQFRHRPLGDAGDQRRRPRRDRGQRRRAPRGPRTASRDERNGRGLEPRRTVEQVELATLEYVWWWNNQRLRGELDLRTPAEVEQTYYADLESAQPATAGQGNQ